jgi:purine-cytosine permease-like protein
MADPATSPDPDVRRSKIAIAVLVGLLLLVALLTIVFGLNALYLSAALATPVAIILIILLSLESSNPEHAKVMFAEDEDEKV